MKRLLIAGLAGLSIYAAAGLAMASGEPITRFVNAVWWEDGRFVSGERFVKGGVFVRRTHPDRTVDLQGAFVTPP